MTHIRYDHSEPTRVVLLDPCADREEDFVLAAGSGGVSSSADTTWASFTRTSTSCWCTAQAKPLGVEHVRVEGS
jgi:hypothetical protein